VQATYLEYNTLEVEEEEAGSSRRRGWTLVKQASQSLAKVMGKLWSKNFSADCPMQDWNGLVFIPPLCSVIECWLPLEGHNLKWDSSLQLRQTLKEMTSISGARC
jgi:hypothetical protein